MNASASEGHWRESPKLFIYAVRITNILTCGSNRPSAEEVVRFSRQTVVWPTRVSRGVWTSDLVLHAFLDKECYKKAGCTYSVLLMIFCFHLFTFTFCPWTAWCKQVSLCLFRERRYTRSCYRAKVCNLRTGCKAAVGRSPPKPAALHMHRLCSSAAPLLANSLSLLVNSPSLLVNSPSLLANSPCCGSAHAGSAPASQPPSQPTPRRPGAAPAQPHHCYIPLLQPTLAPRAGS